MRDEKEGIPFESVFQAKAVISREIKKSEKRSTDALLSCDPRGVERKGYREMGVDYRKFFELVLKDLLDGPGDLIVKWITTYRPVVDTKGKLIRYDPEQVRIFCRK